MKIELKYNQRLFLNWIMLHKHNNIGKFRIGNILRNGYYHTSDEYRSDEQRILNKLRSEYMKDYQDTIQK